MPGLVANGFGKAGEFQLSLNPGPVAAYVIERSSDLANRLPWPTNVVGVILFTDPNALLDNSHFYRVSGN
jgi:hypothetical protein